MSLKIRKINEISNAFEISEFPLGSTIKALDKKSSILVYEDGENEIILGYLRKSDVASPKSNYSQMFSKEYGQMYNDLYSNVQSSSDLSTTKSNKTRVLNKGYSVYIGDEFFHGNTATTKHGFSTPFYFIKDYTASSEFAPLASDKDVNAHLVMLEKGSKHYMTKSGTLIEGEGVRINVGVAETDLYSHGLWDESALLVEDVETRLARVITDGDSLYSPTTRRTGFPAISTYHIFNFTDNSSFFMGDAKIEIWKSNADDTVYAKTVYDADGVTVNVDSGSKVTLSVDGSTPTTLVIEDGVVTITTPSMSYDGNVVITGTLQVDGKTTLKTDLDVGAGAKVKVLSGKLITTGMADLA